MHGLAPLSPWVIEACFAPRVWVWGFWLGIALRCAVLFPAGGPFPPSLTLRTNVIHPAAASFAGGATRNPGFAAAARDASNRRAYRQVSSALPFVPMLVESFGRLWAPALTLLGDLADQAVQAGGPGLSRAAFISGLLRKLSAALRRGNTSLFLSGAYVATRAAGRTPMRGLARPSAAVV
jgi:hypothetical protein